MMKCNFSKMHSIGNDFVIIDRVTQTVSLTAKQIRQLGHRQLGIGFDQLLLVEKPKQPKSDFSYRIFNQDGSEVEQCGNGVRCCAQFIWDNQLSTKPILAMANQKGITNVQKQSDGLVAANMGLPTFEPKTIPLLIDHEATQYAFTIHQKIYWLSILAMGNPHATLTVKNIARAPVKKMGSALQQHPLFPQKTNVTFMQILDRNRIKLRVFERGVGETWSCGSGACAAVVSGIRLNQLEKKVIVHMPIGTLTVEWKGDTHPVWLTGPVTTSFIGQIDIGSLL